MISRELNTFLFLFQTDNIAQLMKDRMKILDKEYSSSEDEDSLEELVVDAREKDKWDCESIISTYSNIYNHPKLISEPKVCSLQFINRYMKLQLCKFSCSIHKRSKSIQGQVYRKTFWMNILEN